MSHYPKLSEEQILAIAAVEFRAAAESVYAKTGARIISATMEWIDITGIVDEHRKFATGLINADINFPEGCL